MTVAGVSEVLQGHDLVVVIGAQVFRYYPYVAGEYLPEGTELLQITADPRLAATAPVGDSLLGDTLLVLEQLVDMVDDHSDRLGPGSRRRPPRGRRDRVGAADIRRGVVDIEHRQTGRFAGGHRIDVNDGPATAIPAQHPPGFVLRHP